MAIYTLPYNSRNQLSQHINAQELRCKCGGTHSITVNTDLIDRIEKLLGVVADAYKVNVKDVHINISSANRCKQHDINVGGSGWGMHVVGKALDYRVTCNGQVIDTREIAAIAQELGFTGIGRIPITPGSNIPSDYIHSDVGTIAEHTGSKWLGDECVKGGTSGSVIREPQTYWNYYGISRKKYFPAPVLTPEKQLQTALNGLGEKLDVDGVIGDKSLEALKKHPIRQGERGDYVKAVQTILNAKGYDCGEPDGIAGNKTTAAIFSAACDRMFK